MTQDNLDLWSTAEAYRMESAMYDPFSGMTLQEVTGGPARHFPVEAYAPEPSWLTKLWQPFESFGQQLWKTAAPPIEYTYEKLPELLWETGLREAGLLPKQRVVDEGAGVTVVHTQAPQAGGAPAQPIQTIIPGQPPAYAPVIGAPKAAVISSTVLIGAAVIVLLIIFKR